MIVETAQSNVQIIGEVQKFKTSIDPKNIEYITTLLSSNLYSNPEQSFIREIVSNAWDSHIEAKTTNTPIIIKFSYSDNNWEITIRDFGTGLSPQRFKKIFCNIGSSTKRESNEFIGGFGIGRYSSLACSNTVYITSYYNGIMRLYIMIKDGNTITTNLVVEKITEEKNGIAITIKNITDINPYIDALKYVVFFPNIYIDGPAKTKLINEIKIKWYNNFAVASTIVDNKILLGNVLYPCNYEYLSRENSNFLYSIRRTGITIRFNIGELEITPNRENIIYNKNTINIINNRIQAAKEEIQHIIKQAVPSNYDNFREFWKITHFYIRYDFINNKYYYNNFKYRDRNDFVTKAPNDIMFKGKSFSELSISYINSFFNIILINFIGLYENEKFYRYKIPQAAYDRSSMKAEKLLILKHCNRVTQTIKDWIYNNYKDYTIVSYFDESDLKYYVSSAIIGFKENKETNVLIKFMYDYLISIAKVVDIESDSDFLSYKSKIKYTKSIPTIKNIILYKQEYPRAIKVYCNSIADCIKYLKSFKTGIILTDMSTDNEFYMGLAKVKGFKFIKARKSIVEAINKTKVSCIVDKNRLLSDDPSIIKLHSIQQVFTDVDCPSLYYSKEFLKIVPLLLQEPFKDIMTFNNKYKNSTYAALAYKCKKTDPYTIKICEKLKHYNTLYNKICKMCNINMYESSLNNLIIALIILRTKTFRINYSTYYEIKNNKILKILCKK